MSKTTDMIRTATTAAALAIGALTLVAGPANAVDGGADSCDPATQPAPVTRVEHSHPVAIIHAKVTHTASTCSPFGFWVIVGQHTDEYKMLNRDHGCRTFTRKGDALAGTLTAWKSTGSATNC